ncbi:MAG: histidine ammonia-lyase [Gemmatimonadaceae bacterium]|nr:histidine ammonia-lyase [Gemmatimonadaceae bacterium]
MSTLPAITVDGRSLTLAALRDVAEGRARATLGADARERMVASRRVVDGIVASGAPVYGVTTGFGKMSDVRIPGDKLAELQVNLVRSHVVGVGPLLARREVRAMMLLRANVLAAGYSGARPLLADSILAMLNADLWPPVPEQGSVGASGDLAPLAHLALSLIGEGDLFHGDDRMPAAQALAAADIAPVTLASKEGLALINGTQAHTGVASLALLDAETLWQTAQVAGAATLDALMGTPDAFDDRIHAARGQPGQRESARRLMELLEGSAIRESHRVGDPRVQDAYALRCMPQVHGPVLEAIGFVKGILSREITAATDNPLVLPDGTLISGGNFHGQAGALASDVLAIALTNLATISERRIDRLVNPDLNEGLPAFLAQDPGLHSGYMIAQVTAAALTSECKALAHPASVDTIPTDGGKEDVVPMAMGAAVKLRRVVHNVAHVLAIELMCAAQGIEYRRPLTSSARIEEAVARVRRIVPRLEADRVVAGDIAALASAIRSATFIV